MSGDAVRAAFDVLKNTEGETWYRVTGTSMLPYFREGDMLRISTDTGSGLHVGGIYVFQAGGVVLVHRLIRKSRRGLVFRGDNRVDFDPPVLPGQVVGEVTHLKRGGRVFRMAAGKIKFLGLVFVVYGLLAAPLVQRLYTVRRKIWGARPVPGANWVRKAKEGFWGLFLR